MKFLVAGLLTLTATSAMALGEGRYVSTATTNPRGFPVVFITDTKTGKVRICVAISYEISCSKWSKDASE